MMLGDPAHLRMFATSRSHVPDLAPPGLADPRLRPPALRRRLALFHPTRVQPPGGSTIARPQPRSPAPRWGRSGGRLRFDRHATMPCAAGPTFAIASIRRRVGWVIGFGDTALSLDASEGNRRPAAEPGFLACG
ncbi:MAG: hypothetical protein AB7P69_21835 [Candidatus Binatia bacterium]